jgi:hypothetical protein
MRTRWRASAVTILVAAMSAGCTAPAGSVHAPESVVAPSATTVDPTPADTPMTRAPTQTPPDRTVDESGGFLLTTLSSAACTAEAPADWSMQAPDSSDRADLLSPDGSLYAGYGIQAINTTLAPYAAAYDPPLNDPDLYSADPGSVAIAYGRIIVTGIGGSPDIVGGELYQPADDYLLAVVSGSTHQGAIVFHATGFAGDGVNYAYALPMYFAFGTSDRWPQMGPLVARVAASIRCSTQFQPPHDYFWVEANDAATAVDANGDEAGYNPQLGTEHANDPTTGENYLVDPSVNWSETGPDGPGYYVQKGGNDYLKLEPGRAD